MREFRYYDDRNGFTSVYSVDNGFDVHFRKAYLFYNKVDKLRLIRNDISKIARVGRVCLRPARDISVLLSNYQKGGKL